MHLVAKKSSSQIETLKYGDLKGPLRNARHAPVIRLTKGLRKDNVSCTNFDFANLPLICKQQDKSLPRLYQDLEINCATS